MRHNASDRSEHEQTIPPEPNPVFKTKVPLAVLKGKKSQADKVVIFFFYTITFLDFSGWISVSKQTLV
jgi:hypothetical protein